MRFTDLQILNQTCTSADTEYSVAIPANIAGFSLQCRDSAHAIRLAFQEGDAAATRPHLTIKGGQRRYEVDNLTGRSRTLYLQSSNAGAVLEIVLWK